MKKGQGIVPNMLQNVQNKGLKTPNFAFFIGPERERPLDQWPSSNNVKRALVPGAILESLLLDVLCLKLRDTSGCVVVNFETHNTQNA